MDSKPSVVAASGTDGAGARDGAGVGNAALAASTDTLNPTADAGTEAATTVSGAGAGAGAAAGGAAASGGGKVEEGVCSFCRRTDRDAEAFKSWSRCAECASCRDDALFFNVMAQTYHTAEQLQSAPPPIPTRAASSPHGDAFASPLQLVTISDLNKTANLIDPPVWNRMVAGRSHPLVLLSYVGPFSATRIVALDQIREYDADMRFLCFVKEGDVVPGTKGAFAAALAKGWGVPVGGVHLIDDGEPNVASVLAAGGTAKQVFSMHDVAKSLGARFGFDFTPELSSELRPRADDGDGRGDGGRRRGSGDRGGRRGGGDRRRGSGDGRRHRDGDRRHSGASSGGDHGGRGDGEHRHRRGGGDRDRDREHGRGHSHGRRRDSGGRRGSGDGDGDGGARPARSHRHSRDHDARTSRDNFAPE